MHVVYVYMCSFVVLVLSSILYCTVLYGFHPGRDSVPEAADPRRPALRQCVSGGRQSQRPAGLRVLRLRLEGHGARGECPCHH